MRLMGQVGRRGAKLRGCPLSAWGGARGDEGRPGSGSEEDEGPQEKAEPPHDAHEDSGWSSDFSSIPLRLLGFGVLMGWHFLLLFFPLMISNERLLPEYLFQRQLVLNTSLGVFFIVFGWVLERFALQAGTRR